MKTQEQDFYHGVALAQIVRHESFKALNSGSPKQGHYLINNDRHLLVKYRTNDGDSWQFTFKVEEILAIKSMAKKSSNVFICLVCGGATICALTFDEIKELLAPKSEHQSITVSAPVGGSLHVRGSLGELSKTVPHNSFPKKLFD